VVVKACAKINLGLEVVGTRPDGYHDILTLFQTVAFSDELEFASAGRGELTLRGDDPDVPWDETNLVHRAAAALRARAGTVRGVAITVRKRVPAGRGLGGGSADAAATLTALDELWGTELGREPLAELARGLGADVPYFLTGGLCLGSGRGDDLEPLPDLPAFFAVLALPPFPVATASVYRAFPAALTSGGKDSKIRRFLGAGDFGLLENGLETVLFRSYPQLAELKRFFLERGAMCSMVSGSGSAVYGLFRDRAEAESARAAVASAVPAVLVETLSRERYWAGFHAGV
jgi:4-diphosphocytidyl-2-C-methyl-D-erythritol kinase